jgi:hypothetical protein
VIVIDFIFTRCDGACPLLTAKLNQVRKHLGDLLGTEVAFVSISVDPEFDTPVELARFARAQNAIYPGWTFVTGKKEDIEAIVKKLGQYSPDVEDHSTAMIAGNARRNHWVKIHPGWAPAAIAEQVRRRRAEVVLGFVLDLSRWAASAPKPHRGAGAVGRRLFSGLYSTCPGGRLLPGIFVSLRALRVPAQWAARALFHLGAWQVDAAFHASNHRGVALRLLRACLVVARSVVGDIDHPQHEQHGENHHQPEYELAHASENRHSTLPGFSIPRGSNAALMRRISSSSSGDL